VNEKSGRACDERGAARKGAGRAGWRLEPGALAGLLWLAGCDGQRLVPLFEVPLLANEESDLLGRQPDRVAQRQPKPVDFEDDLLKLRELLGHAPIIPRRLSVSWRSLDVRQLTCRIERSRLSVVGRPVR